MIAQAKTIDDAMVLYTSELMKRVSIDTMNAALEKPYFAKMVWYAR